MGLFRRRGGGGDGNGETEALTTITEEVPPIPDIDDAITEKAQEIMKSNLEIMKDIVMKIRNEPGYAKSMYINCPRLQHLLEQNPDLRPVFEDPRLVRINFETVYKEAGGILPEDDDAEGGEDDETKNKKSWILWIANSPFFKILKALLMIKKLVGCIAGGGIAAIGGIIAFMTDCCTDCCCEDAFEEIELEDDLEDIDDLNGGSLDPNAQALNQAADYMEDPNVQEQMQRLLEDPDNLADAIENDSELRTLRDSNPLCAELMQDPETMRILVDPDNLRALGEAPQMIELDFADPNGFIPEDDFIDIEMGDDADYAALDVAYDGDGGGDFDADAEDAEGWEEDNEMNGDDAEGDDAEGDEEEEEDEGWEEDIEMEETELDADNNNAEAAKGKGKGGNNKKSAAQEAAAKKGGMAGVIASIGVAATDVIASQIVGQVFGDIPLGDLMSSGGGGDDIDLGGLDSAGDMVNDDIADIAEDGVDEVKDGKDGMKGGPLLSHAEFASGDDSMYDADGRKRVAVGAGAAAGAMLIGGVGAGAMLHGKRKVSEDNLAIPEGHGEKDESDSDDFDSVNSNEDYDEFDDEENTKNKDDGDDDDDDKKKKKKRFGFGALKDIAAATATAAKETLASTFLGDDVAEMLVERMEESDSDEDDDDDGKKKKRKGKKNNDDDIESGDEFEDEVEKPKSKKPGVFRGGKR